LFEKIRDAENSGKKILVHCRAGVGRSGTLRLMYKAWKKELTTDGLVSAMNTQRALRKYAVQTKLQYIFLQDYIRTSEEKKSTVQSFQDIGGVAFNNEDYPQATFWFFMYQRYGLGGLNYRNVDTAATKCPAEYASFLPFLMNKFYSKLLPVTSTWERVQKLWAMRQ
jgi:hypothetical protein